MTIALLVQCIAVSYKEKERCTDIRAQTHTVKNVLYDVRARSCLRLPQHS